MSKHLPKSTLSNSETVSAQCSDTIKVQEAIQAIFNATCHHPKYVLTVDMKGVFEHRNRDNVLNAMATEWQETLKMGDNSPVFVRYADDWVVIHEEKHILEQAQLWIMAWLLKKKGRALLGDKTRIVTTTEGFDFQGWHIKLQHNDHIKGLYKRQLQSKYKAGRLKTEKERWADKIKLEKAHVLRITPSKSNIQKHKDSLKQVFEQMKAASQEQLIRRLNPMIIEWANYHRHVNSSHAFSSMQQFLEHKLSKWATRRHPTKPWGWVQNRYWYKINQSQQVFGYQDKTTNKIIVVKTYFYKYS